MIPGLIAACDPGSHELGLALVVGQPSGIPVVLGHWRAHASSPDPGKRLLQMSAQINLILRQILRSSPAKQAWLKDNSDGVMTLVIEKPPRMWGSGEGGRGRVQDNFFVLGLAAGCAIHEWMLQNYGPVKLVPVADWRGALKGVHSKGPKEDWKMAAVRTVKNVFRLDVTADVAEAILLGWACTVSPAINP